MVKSPIPQKWVKVGQKKSSLVNLYLVTNYREVGQVGQNSLTHFSDFKSLCDSDLLLQSKSGSAFLERESGKKDKTGDTKCRIRFLVCKKRY